MEELINSKEAQNDLLSCAIYLAGSINSNESQAETLKPIVLEYLEKNDVDNAAHYADVVKDSFTRNQMLVAVITKCVEIDDEEYALHLIEAIDDFGMRARANEAIALQNAAKGNFEKAFEIAEKLDHSATALAGIAIHQAKKGFENEAMHTLSQIDFYKSIVEALLEIAIHFLKQEEIEKAVTYLDKGFGFIDEIEFTEDKIRALLEIGTFFIEAEKNDKAIEVFAKTSSEVEKLDGIHKDNLFTNVAIGFLRAGSIDLADRTLDMVLDKTQIANCLLGFSQVFEKEDKEEALETLEESYAILKSEKESEIRDSKSRFQLFANIAIQFAKLEKIERALEVAHENPVEFQTNYALTNIAQVCILQENDEMANQALKGIDSDSQKLTALVAMSDAYNQAENAEKSIEFLNEATTLTDSIPQFISRTETQNEIAKRFGFYSKNEKAREIASESLNTISEILGSNNRSIALAELSKVYSKYEFTLSEKDREVLEDIVRNTDL